MGQRHLETTTALTIDRVAHRLEVESAITVADAAFDHAGESVAAEYGRRAAVIGAVRLAARRTGVGTPDRDRIAAAFDIDPERVVAATMSLRTHLSPPADSDEVRTLRRRLIVAQELLAALECDHTAGPELPGSRLADAAPLLLARASTQLDSHTECEYPGLDAPALRDHIARLEADLELAQLGTTLYTLVYTEQ